MSIQLSSVANKTCVIIIIILNILYASYGFMSHCFTLVLSENCSDELMLPNYHVTDVK